MRTFARPCIRKILSSEPNDVGAHISSRSFCFYRLRFVNIQLVITVRHNYVNGKSN